MTVTDSLESMLAGPVFRPGQPGYADEVAGFNLASTHTPEIVVGATSPDDVRTAVRWAVDRELPIAVQATGHGASSAIDGGLLISTRRMNSVDIDAERRTATLGAGATWADVLAAAAPHGLAGLPGSSSGVGVVGYTLGGGLPVFGRAHGWAADHVRGIQVVTPDGTVREVDAEREPDLFWALRGGKGNVGVVTSMTIGLVPQARFYGGAIAFPGEHAADLLSAYAEWAPSLPEEMSTALLLLRLPPFPDVPEPLRGKFTVQLSVAYAGDQAEAERLLEPLRSAAPVALDGVAERPSTEMDRVYNDPDHPVPAQEASLLLGELTGDLLADILRLAGPDAQTPLLFVGLRQMGGALARPTAGEDAICARDAQFLMQTIGVLAGPHAAEVPAALAEVCTTIAPHSLGRTLLNIHGRPGDDDDRARAWTPDVLDRLRQIKGRYDPANLLRFGHAVQPL
jgi:FAD/FMN-containing dehydrogenase